MLSRRAGAGGRAAADGVMVADAVMVAVFLGTTGHAWRILSRRCGAIIH